MAEYIEREAFLEVLMKSHKAHANNSREESLLSRDIRLLNEQPAADVVSRAAFDQVMWERDTAMEQLKEHGIPFGGEADVVAVVRCKDCKYRSGLNGRPPYMFYICTCAEGLTGAVRENHFCSYGERRDEDA
jgi:hypothetical protein